MKHDRKLELARGARWHANNVKRREDYRCAFCGAHHGHWTLHLKGGRLQDLGETGPYGPSGKQTDGILVDLRVVYVFPRDWGFEPEIWDYAALCQVCALGYAAMSEAERSFVLVQSGFIMHLMKHHDEAYQQSMYERGKEHPHSLTHIGEQFL